MNVIKSIELERKYQESQWGTEFDDKNTANDWATYISNYTSKATELPWNPVVWRKNMLKVATLAVAAIEAFDRNGGLPPRHYDGQDGTPSASGRDGTNKVQPPF